jgi:hypothetical protein
MSAAGLLRQLLWRGDAVAYGGGAECAGRPAGSRWCKSITMKE